MTKPPTYNDGVAMGMLLAVAIIRNRMIDIPQKTLDEHRANQKLAKDKP